MGLVTMRRAARMGAALLLLVAPPAAAQASHGEPAPPARGDVAPVAPGAPLPLVPHGFLGYTFCRNGMAESWIRADVAGTPVGEEVLAHEAVHREQARGFPTCEAWQQSLVSAKRVIDAEIPAYCAQFRLLTARGMDADSLRLEYALRIAAQAGAIENRLDVRGLFRDRCG